MGRDLQYSGPGDLEDHDPRLRALTEHSLDIVAILDPQGVIRYQSPSLHRILGWTPTELRGHYALEHVHPEDRQLLEELLARNIAEEGNIISIEYRYRHRNGQWRTLESIATNLLHDPDIQGIVINSRDITQRKQQEEALRTSNEQFTNAFEYAAIGMALVGTSGAWLKVNHALCDFVGYSPQDLTGQNSADISHPDDLPQELNNIQRLLKDEVAYCHMEKRYIHKQAHILWGHLAVSVVRDTNGLPVHLVYQIQDITEKKRAEERLIHHALHDSLTGLANRTLLNDHIQYAYNRYLRYPDQPFALILADLDRFKNINDTRGHMAGDKVLLEAAERLKAAVRSTDTVARLGGDEFAILLEDIFAENTPTRIARRLLDDLHRPINVDGSNLHVGVSLGVVVVTADHQSTEEVFRDADIALYRAKTAGRGNYQVFDQEMHVRIRERMELEAELRRALQRSQTEIFLQPIVQLATGKIVSFEALLRWNHPQKGCISPAVFIPMAEEAGLIESLGAWVTAEVCRIVSTWPHGNPPPVSMNVSSAEMFETDTTTDSGPLVAESLDARIQRIAKKYNVPPHLLRIEITESVLIEDLQHATKVLDNLVQNGFQLLLDDFGTGYSSFSYLQDLPFYQIKLDSKFTSRLEPRNRSYELMRGIITLAHNIGLQVVAEGIETQRQLDMIRLAGCDHAQGYLISHPLPVKEAHKLYAPAKPLIRKR